jgi:hypothetical protein
MIISPSGLNHTHITFIETRYSAESSTKSESRAEYIKKYTRTLKEASILVNALLQEENMTLDWHFVYALYRKTGITEEDLLGRSVLLDRQSLDAFYGPSLSSLGML